jgi:hypothetical protein
VKKLWIISITNVQDEESNQQTTFTRAEVEEIIRELKERRESQRQLQTIGSETPFDLGRYIYSPTQGQF